MANNIFLFTTLCQNIKYLLSNIYQITAKKNRAKWHGLCEFEQGDLKQYQVFIFFFFAAGKRILFKIRR